MGRKPATQSAALSRELKTRVTDAKFQELQAILKHSTHSEMSGLLRAILMGQPIKVLTQDQSLSNVMEELARIRTEIRSIGVNINQITRLFNLYPEKHRKEFYAKTAFSTYEALQPKIDRLLTLVSNLAIKWLSE
jgi:hypothetical protein